MVSQGQLLSEQVDSDSYFIDLSIECPDRGEKYVTVTYMLQTAEIV